MERQWRGERELGGTEEIEEGWESIAGFLWDEAIAGFAWKACKNDEIDSTEAIVNQRKPEDEGTVSSRMTEEDTAKWTPAKIRREPH